MGSIPITSTMNAYQKAYCHALIKTMQLTIAEFTGFLRRHKASPNLIECTRAIDSALSLLKAVIEEDTNPTDES